MRFAAMRFAIRRAALTPQMTSFQVFVVASRVSAQSMKELMAQMGSQPGGLNFGTTGIDSRNHIAMEMFLQAAGLKAVHVPYKGDAGLFPGLFANDVQIAFAASQAAVAHMKAGRVRALAVTALRRSSALDLPTIAEASGLSNYEFSGWTSLCATAGAPREILLRINDETAKILRSAGGKRHTLGTSGLPDSRDRAGLWNTLGDAQFHRIRSGGGLECGGLVLRSWW